MSKLLEFSFFACKFPHNFNLQSLVLVFLAVFLILMNHLNSLNEISWKEILTVDKCLREKLCQVINERIFLL